MANPNTPVRTPEPWKMRLILWGARRLGVKVDLAYTCLR